MGPYVEFPMETNGNTTMMELVRVKMGFQCELVVESIGLSGGLCLLWSGKVTIDLISYSPFHIDVKVMSHDSNCWRLTGFYGSPILDSYRHSWTLLRRLHGMSDLPWLCVGDFNDILGDEKKQRGQIRSRSLMDEFRGALDYYGLKDMRLCGPAFTWYNRRNGKAMVQERLNRGVGNYDWQMLFLNSRVKHLEYCNSDHQPILVKSLDDF
ncbi:hypothetical protein Dsin_015626 [Dipteronia sinensis]|uniref:Endonuclease/exonuclease/phosphatase domain-containing protein n=1 Tax=Dipteronia sinensis TaxID=43782 RepID=A0AAE0E576_9ROSI|nr:hypothetical protein Dsin_015626 [Dipteronia sinensis]